MADLNNVTMVGRLTRDAIKKVLPSGYTVVNFSIAVDTGFGEYKKTMFIEVKFFGKAAEGVASYLTKGKQVGITGELTQEEWTGADGNERQKFVINCRGCSLMASPKESGSHVDSDNGYTTDLFKDATVTARTEPKYSGTGLKF
jgi:single-strand DNA-binding protein